MPPFSAGRSPSSKRPDENVQAFVDEADCRIVVQLMNKGHEVPLLLVLLLLVLLLLVLLLKATNTPKRKHHFWSQGHALQNSRCPRKEGCDKSALSEL